MRRPVERQERAKGNEQASWEKPPDNEESYKGFFTEVDKDPSFPGGEEKMYQYIKGKIDYSAFSEGYKDTGTVVVSFMVRPTGNLYRVQIKKGLNRRIDEAVIRVFQNMPKWKPGQQNGRKVNVYREVLIKFG